MTTKLDEIQFTEEQLGAIDALKEFVTDMFTASWYFVFTGFAGTGKTTCMKKVAEIAQSRSLKIEYTAPTNKAAKVLREVTGKAVTTYVFLNLRMTRDGAAKAITRGKTKRNYSKIDVVVVDEASMVNKELFGYLEDAARKYGFKVIFMGDPAQLPPVNETESKALKGEVGASLKKVMRHDNQILTFATKVREQIYMRNPSIKLLNDNDGEEGVWVLDKSDFKEMIFYAAREGEFNGETSKIIAWRNEQVRYYNDLVRIATYGDKAVPGEFLKGERITVGSVCMWGEEVLMTTDDEGLILDIDIGVHPLYRQFKSFKLTVQPDFGAGGTVTLYKIHPDSETDYDQSVQELADSARKNPKLWQHYWELIEHFHDVRYANAMTAHKSQGSTYVNAYVDSQDIMRNRNTKEAFSCFYVASTRPTTRLIIT